jgi:hypothetical protein
MPTGTLKCAPRSGRIVSDAASGPGAPGASVKLSVNGARSAGKLSVSTWPPRTAGANGDCIAFVCLSRRLPGGTDASGWNHFAGDARYTPLHGATLWQFVAQCNAADAGHSVDSAAHRSSSNAIVDLRETSGRRAAGPARLQAVSRARMLMDERMQRHAVQLVHMSVCLPACANSRLSIRHSRAPGATHHCSTGAAPLDKQSSMPVTWQVTS